MRSYVPPDLQKNNNSDLFTLALLEHDSKIKELSDRDDHNTPVEVIFNLRGCKSKLFMMIGSLLLDILNMGVRNTIALEQRVRLIRLLKT